MGTCVAPEGIELEAITSYREPAMKMIGDKTRRKSRIRTYPRRKKIHRMKNGLP